MVEEQINLQPMNINKNPYRRSGFQLVKTSSLEIADGDKDNSHQIFGGGDLCQDVTNR